MEKIEKSEIINEILRFNRHAKPEAMTLYAECFAEYLEAADNIARNGTIVAHPRTGAPMENPYLKIRAAALKGMLSAKLRDTNSLWQRWGTLGAVEAPG